MILHKPRSAVDLRHLAGDPRPQVGDEIEDGPGHICGDARPFEGDAGHDTLVLLQPGEGLVEGGFGDEAGGQGVDRDPLGGQFLGQPPGQTDHPGLAGCIGNRAVAATVAPGQGGHVDDAPALGHKGQHGPGDVKSAGQVDVDHLVPVGVVHLQDRHPADQVAGVVDQNIDLAIQGGGGLGHHLIDLGALCGVEVEGLCRSTLFQNTIHRSLGSGLVRIVGQDHVDPARGQGFGDPRPDANIAAGDEGAFAG